MQRRIADSGKWKLKEEGDSQTYTMGNFHIRWLAYAQCWRAAYLGEPVFTASHLRVVMDYCEALVPHD